MLSYSDMDEHAPDGFSLLRIWRGWRREVRRGIVMFAAVVAVDHAAGAGGTALRSQIGRVVASSVLLLPAMFLVGLVISLLLRAYATRVGRLYGADLVGGGVGCLLLLPLMRWIGGDGGSPTASGLLVLFLALVLQPDGVPDLGIGLREPVGGEHFSRRAGKRSILSAEHRALVARTHGCS